MAESSDFNIRLLFDMRQFRTGLQNVQRDASGFQRSMRSIAGWVGVAFSAREALNFARSTAELNAQAQGVADAYERMGNTSGDLERLRDAVGGTVSDLELMTRANMARQFGISMDVLATGLEYARRQARATGQEVNILVDQFVLGLGRQSAARIDDLGISQSQLNKELAKGKDFAEAVASVMRERMAEAGEYTETAADEVERLASNWRDFKAEIGNSQFLATVVGHLSNLVDMARDYRKFASMTSAGLYLPTREEVQQNETFSRAMIQRYREALEAGELTVEQIEQFSQELTQRIDSITVDSDQAGDHRARLITDLEHIKKLLSDIAAEEARAQAQARERAEEQARAAALRPIQLQAKGPANVLGERPQTEIQRRDHAGEAQLRSDMEARIELQQRMNQEAEYYAAIQQVMAGAFQDALFSGEDFFETLGEHARAFVEQLIAQLMAILAMSAVIYAINPAMGFTGAFNLAASGGDGWSQMILRGGDIFGSFNAGAGQVERSGG